jgi:hypothetical protein
VASAFCRKYPSGNVAGVKNNESERKWKSIWRNGNESAHRMKMKIIIEMAIMKAKSIIINGM